MAATTFVNGHALLIGVGADLPVTVKDATALRDLLVAPNRAAYPPEQVELLTETSADRPGILQAFDRLIERVGKNPDATVIVYYSGHGGRVVSAGKSPEYYLVPYGYNPGQRSETAVSGQEFTEKIEALKTRKAVVLLDCCHAGGVPAVKTEGEKFVHSPLPPDLMAKLGDGSGRVIVSSSREDEFSYTGDPYSVFAGCLLESLRGGGAVSQDGYARVLNVLVCLFDQAPKRAGGKQHPFVKKVLDLGDNFPLCYYAGGSKSLPDSQSAVASEPPPGYHGWKRRRLEQEHDALQSEWEIRSKKVKLFRKNLAIEAGSAIKFQLEEELLQEEASLARLCGKLEEIERALGNG